MKILGIETSCDETAVAVVEDGRKILSSVVASSSDMHKKYGGILPEVAAREQLKYMLPTVTESLRQAFPQLSALNSQLSSIDALAVTVGPGLIGSLLIGIETTKTMAFVTGKPVIPVNHILAHVYANLISHPDAGRDPSIVSGQITMDSGQSLPRTLIRGRNDKVEFPAIALVVSGGHTELFLMESEKNMKWLGGTLDDAAGEAFDKTARLLGFGNQGGKAIEQAAKHVNRSSSLVHHLPRPLLHDATLNFSFSGLKTAVLREWKKIYTEQSTTNDQRIHEFAYEIQEAITDVLVSKTLKAAKQYNAQSILVAGGVAANKRLREKFLAKNDKRLTNNIFFPPIELCTDNAVTIASYAYFYNNPQDWHEITAQPNLSVELTE